MIDILMYFIKEIAEILRRAFLRQFSLKNVSEKIFRELKEDGIVVVPNFLSSKQCLELCSIIDDLLQKPELESKIWVDVLSSDHRIFGIEKLCPSFNFLLEKELIKSTQVAYTGRPNAQTMVLGAKLEAVAGNLGSGGGWHRDSPHSTQFKAIIYLSDVGLDNGPFEYIKRSHRPLNLFKNILSGLTRPNQYRFTHDEISSLAIYKKNAVKYIAKAGTLILVDVKGIHRGAPISEGSRYAVTLYFGDPELGVDF